MKQHRRSTLATLLAAAAGAGYAQRGGNPDPVQTTSPDATLPNGKLQRDEILKSDHEKNLKDAAELVELAHQLQNDIEKNGAFVFSLATLKKTDDLEKLVKKIRGRMVRN